MKNWREVVGKGDKRYYIGELREKQPSQENNALVDQGFTVYKTDYKLFYLLLTSNSVRLAQHVLLALFYKYGKQKGE